MSLIIIKEPKVDRHKRADQLKIGTWFKDRDDQLFLIALDDRTNEKRLLSVGSMYNPFIAKCVLGEFEVSKILPVGTQLQITEKIDFGKGE